MNKPIGECNATIKQRADALEEIMDIVTLKGSYLPENYEVLK